MSGEHHPVAQSERFGPSAQRQTIRVVHEEVAVDRAQTLADDQQARIRVQSRHDGHRVDEVIKPFDGQSRAIAERIGTPSGTWNSCRRLAGRGATD